jgi:heme-degrading monooxygenase HmoA
MEMVITRVVLDDGASGEWERVMGDRMTAAESSPGWLGGSIARPDGGSAERLIVGLWESRDAWKRWHEDPAFRDTAERL